MPTKLNPKIWNDDESLKENISNDLKKITNEFISYAKINPNNIIDIIFVGSMANYNWHDKSDIDLHIIIDAKKYTPETLDFIKDYLLNKKSLWNYKHTISIYGYPVELYPEFNDMESFHDSVYSLMQNDWIIEPTKKNIDDQLESKKSEIDKKYNNFVKKIDYLYKLSHRKNIDLDELLRKIAKLKSSIWNLRASDLKRDSIYSIGNLVFKKLRNAEYLAKLLDLENTIYDKNLTIEQTQILENYIGTIVSITNKKTSLFQNPKNIEGFPDNVRGAIDLNGNIYLTNNDLIMHRDIYKFLQSYLNLSEYQRDWYVKLPSNIGLLFIIRTGDNIFELADSYGAINMTNKFIEDVKKFIIKAKVKHTSYTFI